MKRIRTPNAPRRAESGTPRKHMLYVEDNEANRQVASVRLERKYEVSFAASDEQACRLLIERGPSIELILMDIELQGSRLDGIELTRLVRGQLPEERKPPYAQGVQPLDVPILFVTAYAQAHRRAELLAAGGDELIAKPVDFVALQTTIARVYLQRMK